LLRLVVNEGLAASRTACGGAPGVCRFGSLEALLVSRLAKWLLPSAATVPLLVPCECRARPDRRAAHVQVVLPPSTSRNSPVVLDRVLNASFEALTGLSILGLHDRRDSGAAPSGARLASAPSTWRPVGCATTSKIIARAATAFVFILHLGDWWHPAHAGTQEPTQRCVGCHSAWHCGGHGGRVRPWPLSALGIFVLYEHRDLAGWRVPSG